jgi:hypothetical protein
LTISYVDPFKTKPPPPPLQGARLVLFPDDTNLLVTGKDESDLQHKIKNIMEELEMRLYKNNLMINSGRTTAM